VLPWARPMSAGNAEVNPSDRQIEKVVDLIYDAAAENDLWRNVLTAIADLTNSQGGILFGVSFATHAVYFDFNGRLDEECNRVYQERHMQNPYADYMVRQPVGRLVLSDEIIEMSKFRATSFYNDVFRPQNITHSAMMALAAQQDFRVAFNICRGASQGPLKADEQRLLELFSPHLRRSAALGFHIEAYRSIRDAAFNVLDRLADGVAILDRNARILFANAAARGIEAEGELRLHPSIALTSPAYSSRLIALIKLALSGGAGGTMSFPSGIDGRLLTIMVSSIRGRSTGRLSDAGFKDAAVLLFIIDPANRRSIPLGQIMDAYGLTHAEARVALAVSSGHTVGEAARLLNLSPNTIKTHLRRVFAKTSTGRQAELAALITAVGTLCLPTEGQ
jgi:DNA-binding CsgD family transcriptional regulator/PAS domain-containing protein